MGLIDSFRLALTVIYQSEFIDQQINSFQSHLFQDNVLCIITESHIIP